jgi:predicted HicB family RNase H-like nuclease
MMNVMEINAYRAVIQYDPEIDMFRGEFLGLNGGADFYAKDIEGLRREGEISLKVFLEMCQEDGVEPRKDYSGKFNLRVPPDLHAELAVRAASTGKSLNQLISEMLVQSVQTVSVE